MKDLTLHDLTAPMFALRKLAHEHHELPVGVINMTWIFPDELTVSLHDDLGSFEAWREALEVPPADVRQHVQSGGTTLVLQADVKYAGVTIHLAAYSPVPLAVAV